MNRSQADKILERHPNWSHCSKCGELFTSDSAFNAHLGSVPVVGRPKCKSPDAVKLGKTSPRRLVYDEQKQAWRWDAEGDTRSFRDRPAAA